jgi:hypothetical protein
MSDAAVGLPPARAPGIPRPGPGRAAMLATVHREANVQPERLADRGRPAARDFPSCSRAPADEEVCWPRGDRGAAVMGSSRSAISTAALASGAAIATDSGGLRK